MENWKKENKGTERNGVECNDDRSIAGIGNPDVFQCTSKAPIYEAYAFLLSLLIFLCIFFFIIG